MTATRTASKIETAYAEGEQPAERGPATSLQEFIIVFLDEPSVPVESLTFSRSTASVLRDYTEAVATQRSEARIAVGPEDEKHRAPTRHAAMIALLDEWLAEDTEEDEAGWQMLKKRIEESRTSTRKRFSE
jgi:hypothetical protein